MNIWDQLSDVMYQISSSNYLVILILYHTRALVPWGMTNGATIFSIMALVISIKRHYAECHVLFIAMLNVNILSVVMLRVVMLSVVMLTFIMLTVVMLTVIMLSAVEPY